MSSIATVGWLRRTALALSAIAAAAYTTPPAAPARTSRRSPGQANHPIARPRRGHRWAHAVAAVPLAVVTAAIPPTQQAIAAGPTTEHAAVLPAGLTNLQLAGQRVIYSYPGLTPPQSLFDGIRNGQAAGVIFFGENISSDAQIASVI